MKFFALFSLITFLALSSGTDVPTSVHQKVCVKVKTKPTVMRSDINCKPNQLRTMITFDISVPPLSTMVKITLKCFKKKRAIRVTKRDIRCVKVFMKRCRCVPDAEKMACILDKINSCAPQADKEVLPMPTEMM